MTMEPIMALGCDSNEPMATYRALVAVEPVDFAAGLPIARADLHSLTMAAGAFWCLLTHEPAAGEVIDQLHAWFEGDTAEQLPIIFERVERLLAADVRELIDITLARLDELFGRGAP